MQNDLRTLVKGYQKNARALKINGLKPNEYTEVLLFNLILKTLHKKARKHYEVCLNSSELVNWNDFITFLKKLC